MHITIIGTGFVGVVTAAVYASLGHTVIGLDVDQKKIDQLKQGVVPFFEPGLTELLLEQQRKNSLSFTTSYEEAISDAEVIMIAVGTPSAPDGQADLKYVFAACESLAPFLQSQSERKSNRKIVAIKSTVPPGTLAKAEAVIREAYMRAHSDIPAFALASLPEFLKEGSAVEDTLHPDRVVIGAYESRVFEELEKLHEPLHTKIIKVTPESAQMAKYASNAYLATRITFINQIADLCERNGADVQEVISAISPDKRIGSHYWYPGLGYGGSCFPKDVKELAAYSRSVGEANNLFNKIHELNDQRVWQLMEQFGQHVDGWEKKRVAVLGLSFKPNTNDLREAPSTKIIPYLLNAGGMVKGYDPKAVYVPDIDKTIAETDDVATVQNMKANNIDKNSSLVTTQPSAFTQEKTISEAVKDADVILAVIEWPEITQFEFDKTKEQKKQFFIDVRNQFSPAEMKKFGYHYIGIGR